jgi:hypothetical protein
MATPAVATKTFRDLKELNVTEFIERKNDLSYISWVKMVELLLMEDPEAEWNYAVWDGKPYFIVGASNTGMVICTVKAFGRSRTVQMPIIDYKNRAIPDFDAFDLNTTMMRCLAKAIALHGIGLYIYAGEDLPRGLTSLTEELAHKILACKRTEDLELMVTEIVAFVKENPGVKARLSEVYEQQLNRLRNPEKKEAKGVASLKKPKTGDDNAA